MTSQTIRTVQTVEGPTLTVALPADFAGKQVELLVKPLDQATDAVLLEQRFRKLVQQWKQDTEFLSSISEMATHPAYQQIIGMGKDALALIFRELEHEPDHWFWALQAITGENPVLVADRGRIDRMTRTWLEWARTRGYQS